MSLCVEKQWCGFASLKMFVFMWQKYDDFCFMWLKTMIYASFSFSAQDSMDEACAEGIGNEHYRLEGRSLPIFFLSVVKLVGVLFQLNGKKNPYPKNTIWNWTSGICVALWSSASSLPPLLHTHSLSPSNVLMKSLLLFTSSISHPPLPSGALQSASIPPCFFPDVMWSWIKSSGRRKSLPPI